MESTTCANGLIVNWSPILTHKGNCGYLEVIRPNDAPPVRLVLSSWDVAEKIANILIEDFNK